MRRPRWLAGGRLPVSLLGLVVACVLIVPQGAPADPLDFVPAGVEFKLKFSNFESQVVGVGGVLEGIFNITGILDLAGSTTFWTQGATDGTQLTGKFTGLLADLVIPGILGVDLAFLGGQITVYNVPAGTFNQGAGTGGPPPQDLQICPGGVCPPAWLTGDFVPGIIPGDPIHTLFAHVTALTSPGTGAGAGFIEVTGGTAGPRLENNGFPGGADAELNSTIIICAGGPANPDPRCNPANRFNWPVVSEDPVLTRQIVPEPASLLLLGAGLLGFGLWGRRTRRNA